MSTITKEQVIRCILDGGSTWFTIIAGYCKEFNKRDEDIKKLFEYFAINNLTLLSRCYDIALDYFLTKYEIVLVKDENNILITAY